jgi:hypothetical protein
VFVWMNGGGGATTGSTCASRAAWRSTAPVAMPTASAARVHVKTTPQPEEQVEQVQEVRAGSSYLSMDSIDVEFGVGTATVVDEIRISWPSGRRQVLRDVEVDQVLVVEEPEG